jgi:hypothetical protein
MIIAITTKQAVSATAAVDVIAAGSAVERVITIKTVQAVRLI